MVQVDLITGFLGSGKTTFMRHYARYMVQQGWNVCILENDFGAVNVDVMLLQDILGDHCDMESISGGCDCDTHQRRMRTKAPQLDLIRPKRTKSTVFAAGCSFYKIFLLFVIGAFLGDITETIFCRITAGYWMSRSSLVWGPFSIVWGLAIALVTQVLYKYKDRSAFWLFGMGTLLGGAYEYLCSVFTEIVFGAVFWDYSALPFNLGGRINLLYCFFWGLAAVAWFKVLFPPLDRLIESLPRRGGTILTWCLVVFMAVNMIVSSAALIRYDARLEGIAAQTSLDTLLDEHFDDSYMQRVYPKLVHMN